jgi:23S rRNA (uracil1939-C5)-methyltransferase
MTLLEITRLSHDGRGIGHDSAGKTIFVDGVLPGETITCTIQRKKRRFSEAQVLEIVKPAAERVTPGCPHYLTCGGCAQQHISHAVQIQTKQKSLLEQLLHFGSVQPKQLLEPLIGPIWGYRTKARLGVRFVIKKDKVLVGFREKQKSYLADIDSCAILHPSIGNLINALKEFIQTLSGYDQIAQLEVAVGDDQLALIFRNLATLPPQDLTKLINFAQQHNFHLYLQPGGPETVAKIWPADNTERLYYSVPECDLNYAFHPTDFTQINPAINRKMILQALDLLEVNSTDTVLDLFCGLGNFTLPLAQRAAKVTGVEGSEAMVLRGYENAKRNNISNVEFFAADLSKDQTVASWAQQQYTKILLDPPRSGALEILPLVAKIAAQQIVYVSCNPATLARDCGILVNEYGYKLQKVGIIDMFPHTMHVESMALLTKDNIV